MRSGEVFAFEMGGVVHDVVVEVKTVKGAVNEMVQLVTFMPLTVVTNRRYTHSAFMRTQSAPRLSSA